VLPVALTAAALAGCPLFPADFTTNQRIDHLPVAPSSDALSGRDFEVVDTGR
jgi:hypothetical protein